MTDTPPLGPDGAGLDSARRQLSLTRQELWLMYMGLGGVHGIDKFTDYLCGIATISRLEHNTIVQALNERYSERGADHPIAYVDAGP